MYRVPLYRPTTRIPKDFTCNVAKFTREIVAQPLVSSPACHREISWSGSMWPKAYSPPPRESVLPFPPWIRFQLKVISVNRKCFSRHFFLFALSILSLFLFFPLSFSLFFFSYQLDDSQRSLSMSRKRK